MTTGARGGRVRPREAALPVALSVRVTQDEADRLKRFVELRNGVDGDITQQSVLRRMVQAIIEDDEGTAAVRA